MRGKHFWVSLSMSILIALTVGCSGDDQSQNNPAPRQSVVTQVTTPVVTQPATSAAPTVVQQPQQAPVPPAAQSSTSQPMSVDCNAEQSGEEWGTGDRVLGDPDPDPGSYGRISTVDYAPHLCDDWFVVRIEVPEWVEVDVLVGYEDKILSEGKGEDMQLVGGAKLHVVIGMHGEEWASVHGPSPFPSASYFAQWGAVRDIQFAGTHEGLTSFAIGVVERNAYAIYSEYWGGLRRIIVKIAH